jgi:hypothetical protein
VSSRYRRVNVDGKSTFKTETRRVSAGLLPGTFVIIDANDKWAAAPAGTVGRLYVLDVAYHEGLGIRDAIPTDHSAVGNLVEEGRELAILMPIGTYEKDQGIAVGTTGRGVASGATVVGFSQDAAVLTAEDFLRIRFRAGVGSLPAVTSVVVLPATATIDIGATVQLTANVQPPNASQLVAWSTSDAGVATVNANGVVTGVAAGSATITGTAGASTDTTAITVSA